MECMRSKLKTLPDMIMNAYKKKSCVIFWRNGELESQRKEVKERLENVVKWFRVSAFASPLRSEAYSDEDSQ
jgi:predicted nuclease with RNAse H fold